MNSRKVSEKTDRHNRRGEEARRGAGSMVVMGLGSLRVTESQIVNLSRLPVVPNDGPGTELQDAEGNFYFMEGYSHPDGPDIPRPVSGGSGENSGSGDSEGGS